MARSVFATYNQAAQYEAKRQGGRNRREQRTQISIKVVKHSPQGARAPGGQDSGAASRGEKRKAPSFLVVRERRGNQRSDDEQESDDDRQHL